jgi:SAM-dependent methyltransferase
MSAPPQIFDRALLRRRRARASRHVDEVAPILRDVAERLLDRLDDTTHRFARALDVGGRGIVAPLLRARGIATVSCDLSPEMAARNPPPVVAADEEWLPFAAGSFDLIVASLSLHAVNDLPGALIQLRQALRPDGLFLAALPVFGTLEPLRAALAEAEAVLTGGIAPRVAPFPDLRDCAGLLQRAGFALPVADLEEVTVAYADPLALLRDLRVAGETNILAARHRPAPARALFPMALAGMARVGERVRIPLRLAMLTGWAPAASQPQPLRPGSGQVSLAAVLRATPEGD